MDGMTIIIPPYSPWAGILFITMIVYQISKPKGNRVKPRPPLVRFTPHLFSNCFHHKKHIHFRPHFRVTRKSMGQCSVYSVGDKSCNQSSFFMKFSETTKFLDGDSQDI